MQKLHACQFRHQITMGALQVIEERLLNNIHLRSRTSLSTDSIMELLPRTYEDYYAQEDGAAMGSPIVANIYMELFEEMALGTSKTKPKLWVRFVDVTFLLCEHGKDKLDRFHNHLNSCRLSQWKWRRTTDYIF